MFHKKSGEYHIDQGDIFQKFKYIRWVNKEGENLNSDIVDIPYFFVLTQACDLERDFCDRKKSPEDSRDKCIQSILVCPAYLATKVREGTHLQRMGIISEKYNSKTWPPIQKNNNSRYHFIESNDKLKNPDLVIDFKQYYTIPTHILYKIYKEHYLGSLKPLFRENLSHRFAFYLSRIGLPSVEKNNSIAS